MRSLACIAIVVLHTVFASNEYFADSLSLSENLISRIVENNMMWAVPSFVMVTGALQLNKNKELPYKKLYEKYILRIGIALVACCLLFRIFDIVMDGESFTLCGILMGFKELITAKSWGHLWYLYLLIGLYVLMPFYKKIVRHSTTKELVYLSIIYLLFVSVIPLVECLGIHIGFYISESIIYPLYLFLGHMIFEKRIIISQMLAISILLVSTVLIISLDCIKYICCVDIPGEAFGYSSLLVIAQTIGTFALVCGRKCEFRRCLTEVIAKIDSCSFGIYLIHMIFVRTIFRYLGVNPYGGMAITLIPGIIVTIFIISFVVTFLLKKIPGLGRII